MRAVKVLTDPKAFELMADETRRRMVNLLRARELTVSQISEALDKTPQNIYHHIRKLVDGGLVEVVREEKIENFIERYYRATAEIFEITHGKGEEEIDETEVKALLKSLSTAGLMRHFDDQTASKAVKLLQRARSIIFGDALTRRLEKLEDAALAVRLHTSEYAQLLLMSDAQFDEYQKLQRQLRELLRHI